MKANIKKVLGIGVAVIVGGFLLIQLIPYGRNHTNPPIVNEPNWDSPETLALAQRACFDCHSNETIWPWYSNIAPVSWLVQHDVEEGRQEVNFSDWGRGREGEHPGELAESINEGRMPPALFLVTHSEGRLTAAETEALLQGLRATASQ